jgi:MFS family permease
MNRIVLIVFIALVLDILSFTVILPLLPRLIDHYRQMEHANPNTLLSITLSYAAEFRHRILGSASGNDLLRDRHVEVVLLGGALGSLFSFLQFIASPVIGALSDKHGRRRILLLSMVGNIVACALWLVASDFRVFLLSRIVGGLSEGNVQLSIAIISDVTDTTSRSKGLALVGIAFAVGFTIGPALGAWFSQQNMSIGMHPYSGAALFALILILVEFVVIYTLLPETGHMRVDTPQETKRKNKPPKATGALFRAFATYLFLFSGMEFTLTFLTFDVHQFSNMDQGKLLGTIGILSALLQGGYVRRQASTVTNQIKQAKLGMQACILAFVGIAYSAAFARTIYLWMGATGFAVASATVVNAFTAIVSLQCDGDAHKGKILGELRGYGQLGRALGPITACSLYWWLGPVWCYSIGSVCMLLLFIRVDAALST